MDRYIYTSAYCILLTALVDIANIVYRCVYTFTCGASFPLIVSHVFAALFLAADIAVMDVVHDAPPPVPVIAKAENPSSFLVRGTAMLVWLLECFDPDLDDVLWNRCASGNCLSGHVNDTFAVSQDYELLKGDKGLPRTLCP